MTKRRRPNADDRDLADVLRKIKAGRYSVSVSEFSPFDLAPLKHEGTTLINLDGKSIVISPVLT